MDPPLADARYTKLEAATVLMLAFTRRLRNGDEFHINMLPHEWREAHLGFTRFIASDKTVNPRDVNPPVASFSPVVR